MDFPLSSGEFQGFFSFTTVSISSSELKKPPFRPEEKSRLVPRLTAFFSPLPAESSTIFSKKRDRQRQRPHLCGWSADFLRRDEAPPSQKLSSTLPPINKVWSKLHLRFSLPSSIDECESTFPLLCGIEEVLFGGRGPPFFPFCKKLFNFFPSPTGRKISSLFFPLAPESLLCGRPHMCFSGAAL